MTGCLNVWYQCGISDFCTYPTAGVPTQRPIRARKFIREALPICPYVLAISAGKKQYLVILSHDQFPRRLALFPKFHPHIKKGWELLFYDISLGSD